jgi:hypothetical protein
MWKALIKLVEKWAYRCEHKWELAMKNEVFDESSGDKLPKRVDLTYVCSKCMEHKKLS